MEIGTVIKLKLDRGFGFLRSGDRDIFFHAKDLAESLPFDESLQERRVEFIIVGTDKGDRAVNVRAAG